MGVISNYTDKRREIKENKLVYDENLKNSGLTVAFGKVKYLGGYPDLLGEREGNIMVKSVGVFFQAKQNYKFIFIPLEKLVNAEFKTGEEISKNEALSRILAYSGFEFAFNKKTRDKHMYLTINYRENDVESSILFESASANKLASAVTKIIQDYAKEKKITSISFFEGMKQISELKAMSILTEEEFIEKKKELLSRL